MSVEMVSEVLGGIGLFLIGMVLATDGLREAAGDSLREFLLRFTVRPLQAILSSAGITALVQSSSVTTLATISFVSAGLLTFHASLGLILGANVGTTATSWIVALLGLKFSVSLFALPLVGVGALMRLFTRGRYKDIGLAIAGFGVLFVGLDVLQAGMGGMSEFITPETLPRDTWLGRLALAGIGVVLTAVMQSSSAALAITLTALHSDTITLMQGAAMAIGANVGTTVTAGLAIIGAGTAARRVAVAHLLFNMITGVVAFASLSLLVTLIEALGPGNPTIALAAFHTIFNLVGLLLILPFLGPFARLVERMIPERGPRLTRRLEPSLSDHGGLAIEAVRKTVMDIARLAATDVDKLVSEGDASQLRRHIEELKGAIDRTHDFVSTIRDLDGVGSSAQKRHVDAIHALDYLDQFVGLANSMLAQSSRARDGVSKELTRPAREALSCALAWLNRSDQEPETGEVRQTLEELWQRTVVGRKEFREHVLGETAIGEYSPADATRVIEYARQLEELTFHLYRFVNRMELPLEEAREATKDKHEGLSGVA
jgi:phosphate:Na+ symporter